MAINVSTGGTGDTTFAAATIKAAWDQYFEGALRHEPLFRSLVDKRPVDVTSPGSTVTMFIHNDLTPMGEDPSTAKLTDGVDVTPVAYAAPTPVPLTVDAYGRATVHTTLLREFSITDVNAYDAAQVAYDMENTLDRFVRFVANSGTNVAYATGGVSTPAVRADIAAEDVIASDDLRAIVTNLRTAAVKPKRESYYACYMHPHVSYDLRRETGDLGWRPPHTYSAPGLEWKGEVGTWEGLFVVETGRAKVKRDGNATGGLGGGIAWAYRTIVTGQQAIAEGVTIEPGVVFNGKVGADHLSRLYTLGWHGVLGWTIFRQEALRRVESGSSLDGSQIAGTEN